MYQSNSFKQPRTPIVGMRLGVLKSSLEAKLWLKLFLVFGQDRPRKLGTKKQQNGVVTYTCECPTNLCKFIVQIKQTVEQVWIVKTASLEHHSGCESRLHTLDTQLQVYTNIHDSKSMTPSRLMENSHKVGELESIVETEGNRREERLLLTPPQFKDTSALTSELKASAKQYRDSKRAFDILQLDDASRRQLCDDMIHCCVSPTLTRQEPRDNVEVLTDVERSVVFVPVVEEVVQKVKEEEQEEEKEEDVVELTVNETFQHRKPYNWSPIHTHIEYDIKHCSAMSHVQKGPSLVRLTGASIHIVTMDTISTNLMWTEIMKDIFCWSYELCAFDTLPPVRYYFAPGCKSIDRCSFNGIHKFKSVPGETGLRTFVKMYGFSGQSLVRMHTEVHCQLCYNERILIILYEYPLQWVDERGVHAAVPDA
jgi:hypothetical protein